MKLERSRPFCLKLIGRIIGGGRNQARSQDLEKGGAILKE